MESIEPAPAENSPSKQPALFQSDQALPTGSDSEATVSLDAENDAQEQISTSTRKQKGKRKRVLVDVHNNHGPATANSPDIENEYERERRERIKRNQEKMKQLGLQQMATELVVASHAPSEGAPPRRAPRPPKKRQPKGTVRPTRQSARVRGTADDTTNPDDAQTPLAQQQQIEEEEHDMDIESYFKSIGKDISGAIRVEGHYNGWANPEIVQRYGLASDANTAWQSQGGGSFSFKIDKKAIPAHLRSKGWSDAKAFSATLLRKNPNAYFYRHVAPHECQATGEWSAEEHEKFLSVIREFGVGDKWGLFASHIPQRVGYQCSAYYREVVIPSGLVIDPRWRMTRSGKAVFAG